MHTLVYIIYSPVVGYTYEPGYGCYNNSNVVHRAMDNHLVFSYLVVMGSSGTVVFVYPCMVYATTHDLYRFAINEVSGDVMALLPFQYHISRVLVYGSGLLANVIFND